MANAMYYAKQTACVIADKPYSPDALVMAAMLKIRRKMMWADGSAAMLLKLEEAFPGLAKEVKSIERLFEADAPAETTK